MSRYVVLLIALLCAPHLCAEVLSDNQLRNRGMANFDALPAYPGVKDAKTYADAVSYLFAYEQRLKRANKAPDREFQQAFHWLYDHIGDVNVGKGDQIERFIPEGDLAERGISAFRQASDETSFRNGRVWDIGSYIRAQANLFTYRQVAGSGNSRVNSAYSWIQSAQLIQSGTKGDDAGFARWRPSQPKPGSSTTGDFTFEKKMIIAQPLPATIEQDWKQKYEKQLKINEELKEENQQLSSSQRRLQVELRKLRVTLDQCQNPGANTSTQPDDDGEGKYKVVLKETGNSGIQVIKIVRAYTGKGLKDSKALTEHLPNVVLQHNDIHRVKKMAAELQSAGAEVEITE